MNKQELMAFAREAAKSIKTEKDLSDFSQILTKVTVEAALNMAMSPLSVELYTPRAYKLN